MKHFILFVSIVATACGGKQPASVAPAPEPAPVAAVEPAPAPATAPEPTPAPVPQPAPAPKVTKAKAELTPSKGQKFKVATVTFAQPDGGTVAVQSAGFEGLKPGSYHLVVHEGASCSKPGVAVKTPGASDLSFAATADSSTIDLSGVAINVGGDGAVVGHALVLTDDKKGKPGKMLACGSIALDQ